jgi:hypothetical protein
MKYQRGGLTWLYGKGPLLLISRDLLPAWSGIEVPERRVVRAAFRWGRSEARACDYDRACDVNGYVGTLRVGKGQGLVLNDVPMPTAWRASRQGGGLFVRQEYADPGTDFRALLRRARRSFTPERAVFRIARPEAVLFVSSWPGEEVEDGDHLAFRLRPGRYTVHTARFCPDEQTAVVLHRRVPAGRA